jgi:hypothetical protein
MDKFKMPQVRISPAAHRHLTIIIKGFNLSGRNISFTRYLSDLILSQPLPSKKETGIEVDPYSELEDKNG